MSNKISEFYSDDQLRTALVYRRDIGYRIFCYDTHAETEKEFYAETLIEAEEIADDWVLYERK